MEYVGRRYVEVGSKIYSRMGLLVGGAIWTRFCVSIKASGPEATGHRISTTCSLGVVSKSLKWWGSTRGPTSNGWIGLIGWTARKVNQPGVESLLSSSTGAARSSQAFAVGTMCTLQSLWQTFLKSIQTRRTPIRWPRHDVIHNVTPTATQEPGTKQALLIAQHVITGGNYKLITIWLSSILSLLVELITGLQACFSGTCARLRPTA